MTGVVVVLAYTIGHSEGNAISLHETFSTEEEIFLETTFQETSENGVVGGEFVADAFSLIVTEQLPSQVVLVEQAFTEKCPFC